MDPVISSDVGAYVAHLTAWFLYHTDAVYPVARELPIGPIDVVVEEDCPRTSFGNNPAVSTIESYDYVINTGPVTLPLEIAFQPADCNFIKSYAITINGAT